MKARPRIAIPVPTSMDLAYNHRSWPQYASAVIEAGGEPVEVSLSLSPREIATVANTCQAVLLPGSPADVNPQKYGQEASPETAPTDVARENVDELLLQDAHNLHKPILAICYGLQILNVWRGGTLVQHLTGLPVNHEAGKSVAVAHAAVVAIGSVLASLVTPEEASLIEGFPRLPINSSHHQALGIPGDGLRVVARCPQDGVVEAAEGAASLPQASGGEPHFVLGVQWHPERSTAISAASRAIFSSFVAKAAEWKPRRVFTSVA